jgi:hypothetical protein
VNEYKKETNNSQKCELSDTKSISISINPLNASILEKTISDNERILFRDNIKIGKKNI